jgi:TRAP-type C4-dicarboxylate transport system permease small subunit
MMFVTLDRTFAKILRGVPIACLTLLFFLLFVNVVARTFQLAGFAWFDEIVQGLFAWMVFIGTAALWRERDHFDVSWLPEALPPRASRILKTLLIVLSLIFLVTMTWYGASLTMKARALTPILAMPTSLFYVAMPISGFIMMIYSIIELFQLFTHKEPAL